jgi:large subunit ribosomal protein L17
MPGVRKLGKPTDQRIAMLKQQVTDFLDKGTMQRRYGAPRDRPIAEKNDYIRQKVTVCVPE